MLTVSVALAACGAPAPSNGTSDAPRSGTTLEARVILAQPLAHGHFDASSPRAQKVDGQLTAMLGHPLAFYFDAALVPKWEADFQSLSIGALEDVAQRLTVLARVEPAMFAWAAPHLTRIEWDYDATKEYEEAELDAGKGTLRIQLTPKSDAVIAEHQLEYAIGRAYGKTLAARFADVDPKGLGRSDDDRYFEWLTDFAYGYETDRLPAKADEEIDAARAKQILRLLRYADALRGKGAPVEARVRDWLVTPSRYFDQARGSAPDAVVAAPASHPFHLAEVAWTAWLARTIDSLPDSDQERVMEDVTSARERTGAIKAGAYPGFDNVAYALRVADRWRRAGHPSTRDDDDKKNHDRNELFDHVIAPIDFPPDERTGCSRSDALFYADVASDAKTRDLVLADVFARKDPAWEKTVLANLLGVEAQDAVFALWKRSESDDAAFHVALRVLAGHVDGCSFAEADIFDQLPRLWRSHPRSRGPLLFLLSRYGGERVGWDHFERLFDAKLAKSDVTAYLAEEPDPFQHVHWMWPAFAPGWSHADVVVARLDSWLTEHVRRFDMWGGELVTLAEDICTDKSPADSAKLHAWLMARVKLHPSEQQTLDSALEKTKPGGCAP